MIVCVKVKQLYGAMLALKYNTQVNDYQCM